MSGTEKVVVPEFFRQDWLSRAACRVVADPSLFSSPTEESSRSSAQRTARAKALCKTCPALFPCRTYAMEAKEPDGIWGGMTANERIEFRRQSARADNTSRSHRSYWAHNC